jgi:hypothetical protein
MKEYKRKTERYIDEQGKNCVRKLAWDGEILHTLAELEDKIENGTLIELPCGVGDRVYVLDNDKISDKPKISEASVIDFDITSYSFSVLVIENGYDYHLFNCGLGCDWFLSKAEAEAKLKELQNESNNL